MTAEDFADLVGAHLVSPGTWVTQCPAHGGHRAGLIITKGYKGTAQVECLERCSVSSILKSLGLSRREFDAWPAPSPNQLEMEIDELKSFRAERRDRQARHAAACAKLRALQNEVKRIQKEIRSCLDDESLPELEKNLDRAEQKLAAAKLREFELRDLQPSARSEDSQKVIRKAPGWLS